MAHYLYCMQGKEARGWEWNKLHKHAQFPLLPAGFPCCTLWVSCKYPSITETVFGIMYWCALICAFSSVCNPLPVNTSPHKHTCLKPVYNFNMPSEHLNGQKCCSRLNLCNSLLIILCIPVTISWSVYHYRCVTITGHINFDIFIHERYVQCTQYQWLWPGWMSWVARAFQDWPW